MNNINPECWDNDNVDELQKFLQNKRVNAKLINNLFINSCTDGKIQIAQWIINSFGNNYNLKYELGFKNATKNAHDNVINYLLQVIKVSRFLFSQ